MIFFVEPDRFSLNSCAASNINIFVATKLKKYLMQHKMNFSKIVELVNNFQVQILFQNAEWILVHLIKLRVVLVNILDKD